MNISRVFRALIEDEDSMDGREKNLYLWIQINICWIFLALCNNGIQGKEMFENGITRDMFLVACNPDFKEKIEVNPHYN